MTLTFYAGMNISPSSMRKLFARLQNEHHTLAPLENVIFTPIAHGNGTRSEIESLSKELDLNLMFDSGGYEVQVGKKTFDELYEYLLEYYDENRWGQRYVLPDNVPMSDDDAQTVQKKVDETISATRMCFRRLPEDVREDSLAVIQGHTREQISRCIDEYKDLDGLTKVGFGSFATGGVNGGVNMITSEAFKNLRWATEIAHEHGLSVHAFGVGGPTSIPLLYEAGVDSFDTTSWMRTSGYGNVYFPFKGRLNASHRKHRSGNVLTRQELPHLKAETDHSCAFCEHMSRLSNNRWDRILHNLIVTHEVVERIGDMTQQEVIDLMDRSSQYRKRLENITPRREVSL
ncbi:hypothetical protein [Halorubrum sp. SY-15]|uniref:hypothetical protein n=1 Tax=Halorubrum sp. SY-15 TaxID=3402277 RepID=UPI003EBBFA29